MSQPVRVAVITSSRADFGHLHWPLRQMLAHPRIEPKLVVMGAHLAPEFGSTADEIKRQGFTVDETVECLLSSDSDVGMSKSIGLATLGLTEILSRDRPDLVLVIADRYEMLAPASVALALRIPIAHIEGGEISEGAIDDAVRNALTKLSHVHFTPTAMAKQRVLALGEEAWRVHQVGAPSLDHLREATIPGPAELGERLAIDLDQPYCMVSVHPVTLAADPEADAIALLGALENISLAKIICFPNADAGSRKLIRQSRDFCRRNANASLFVNLAHLDYWGLLKHSLFLIGNSSSGIMETPALKLPAVNIGIRQQGRERADNIIDCPAQADQIRAAIDKASSETFRASLYDMQNPYGDGTAGRQIASLIAGLPEKQELLIKKNVPACTDPVLTEQRNPGHG
ncbi:MAG: UDP-N-acetylglucosamine 2-epimerase (hydrolyzing) [Proteobacteria bacterium]|nr:UDP-N-acetylglucosamine 2-epimerase (hydrolyzing) [Pseudomonadota bacterium]